MTFIELIYAHPWWTTIWLLILVSAIPTLKISWSRKKRSDKIDKAIEELLVEQEKKVNEADFPGREQMVAEEARLTLMQKEMCHDKRCPGRQANLLKHRCHDLSCEKHKHLQKGS